MISFTDVMYVNMLNRWCFFRKKKKQKQNKKTCSFQRFHVKIYVGSWICSRILRYIERTVSPFVDVLDIAMNQMWCFARFGWYNLKIVKNTHWGVLLLVNWLGYFPHFLNFTNSSTKLGLIYAPALPGSTTVKEWNLILYLYIFLSRQIDTVFLRKRCSGFRKITTKVQQ